MRLATVQQWFVAQKNPPAAIYGARRGIWGMMRSFRRADFTLM